MGRIARYQPMKGIGAIARQSQGIDECSLSLNRGGQVSVTSPEFWRRYTYSQLSVTSGDFSRHDTYLQNRLGQYQLL
jgi:hypothetical protein